MPSNHLNLFHPLLLLPSIFPSIKVFSNELALRIRWPKYWFSISHSNDIQSWFPLGLTDLISLQSRGLSRVFSSTFESISFSVRHLLYGPTLTSIHDYWKNHNFNYMNLYQQSNADITLCRYVIVFLPRNKRLLISWLQSSSAVILEPPQNKVCHCFPIYLQWSDGTECHDLSFLNVEF